MSTVDIGGNRELESMPLADTQIGVVLIGLGVRGKQWREVLSTHDRARLIAAVEVREEAAAGSGVPVYSSLEEALTIGPNAVIIASPPRTHRRMVEISLGSGLPILCEKPLSEDVLEAIEMAKLADSTGIPLLVGMNFRYTKPSTRLREIVDTEEFGHPIFGNFTYVRNRDGRRPDLNDYPLEMDQPMLIEQSIHHLDLMRFVYSREVESVVARTWNPSTSVYAGDACVAAILSFSSDLVVTYLGTWTSGSARFEFTWRTDFEQGVAVQEDQFGDLFVAAADTSMSAAGPLFNSTGERRIARVGRPENPFIDDTKALLDHFCDVLVGTETTTTAQDHLNTLGLLDAVRVSSASGDAVDVPAHLTELGIPIRWRPGLVG